MAWPCPPFSLSRQGQARKFNKMIHLTGEGHELIVCTPVFTTESRILREEWLQSQILMGFFAVPWDAPLLQESLRVSRSQKCSCLTLLSLCGSIPASKTASAPQIISDLCQNVNSCCSTAQFQLIIPGKSTI